MCSMTASRNIQTRRISQKDEIWKSSDIDDNIQIMIWMYVSHKTRISLLILISVLKIPYTSSHHERNVVTESDYLYVPEI